MVSYTYLKNKMAWETPTLTVVNVKQIKEEEWEKFLSLLSDEENFKILPGSGSDG